MKRRAQHRTSWHAYNYVAPRRARSARSYMVLLFAAVAGTVAGIGSTFDYSGWKARATPDYDALISGCNVVDGDTLRCGDERVRLVGIDAPELPGHCRPGRNCAPGDPYASTDRLSEMVRSSMAIRRYGEDHYGRTIAAVEGAEGDMSCAQIRRGQAIYMPQWDDALHVARACPDLLS